jgi:hypothetical protein
MRQLTSSLATKHFVRFLPYMGLDNKKLLYYTIHGIHKQQQQQQNNSNNLCLLFTLVMKVDYTEVLLIYINNATYGSTLQSIDWKRVMRDLANST